MFYLGNGSIDQLIRFAIKKYCAMTCISFLHHDRANLYLPHSSFDHLAAKVLRLRAHTTMEISTIF